MLFHKKEMEKLKDANICLRQQVHDLSRRIEGCENDCRKLADICSENGCLKEQLEKLRLRLWHMGYEYDRLFCEAELCKVEQTVPGNRKRLSQLKGMYAGRRCFIVGNGPSLQMQDLERIKGEVSFACNRIAEAYPHTSWRPDYYLCTDTIAFADKVAGLIKNEKNILLPVDFLAYMSSADSAIFYPLFRRYSIVPEFSTNILTGGAYDGGTVLYTAAQFAVYMGFRQIILLGVDADYPMTVLPDGRKVVDWKVRSHFYENSLEDAGAIKEFSSWVDYNDTVHRGLYAFTDGWKMLQYQSKQLGIEVINASRGGRLDMFQRKKLEEICIG